MYNFQYDILLSIYLISAEFLTPRTDLRTNYNEALVKFESSFDFGSGVIKYLGEKESIFLLNYK